MIGQGRRNAEDIQNADADGNAKSRPVLIGFRAVYVFDVEQTEGADLPGFEHSISGEVANIANGSLIFLRNRTSPLSSTRESPRLSA
ncbi:MAG TPA: hypothetical protein VMU57_20235 [Edaphobacter sp.]|uniref:hypothetical protein n=1 Tax=Edaphobacter sp. TaxID=1934404 RepID=UPI002C0C00BF|nr:hypothetical protein [Edaphobacter sp.]HUZ97241.1 hypothetical protein [Edaphobacter sp.]